MATTRLMPLHIGKGGTIAAALGRTVDYVENPQKTDSGEWVSAYQCDPLIADQEFRFAKSQYAAITGRSQGERDVIAYHLRQAFRPGEVDPETANKIGYELAMSLTKGRHAFLVCTHVDRRHVHSHIIFNSTSLGCDRKFRNFWNSSFAIRRLSDRLCLEYGLSVIEAPKPSRGSYGSWLEGEKQPSQREQLMGLIDSSVCVGRSFEEFLAAMREAGCEVKQGKHLSFKLPGAEKFIRLCSLSEDYCGDAIWARLEGKRVVVPRTKVQHAPAKYKPSLLIDIQVKLQQGYGAGFERYAKLQNLKECAKTLIYLQERGLDDYATLSAQAEAAGARFDEASAQIKAVEKRLENISTMQKQMGAYSKTREVYRQYRDSKFSKRFLALHEGDILLHRAAKSYFDSLGLQKLPTMQNLRQEYAALSAQKGKLYQTYKQARQSMVELQTAKHMADRILGDAPAVERHSKNLDREVR